MAAQSTAGGDAGFILKMANWVVCSLDGVLSLPAFFQRWKIIVAFALLMLRQYESLYAAGGEASSSLQTREERIKNSTSHNSKVSIPRYKVAGVLTNSTLGGDFVSKFSIHVDACRWQMEILPIIFPPEYDKRSAVRHDSIISGSDGIEFYSTISFASKTRTNSNVAQARRGPGFAPFGVQDQVLAVWYTYGSGCYLGTLRTNLIVPLEFHTPKKIALENGIPGDFFLDGSPPYLPVNIRTYGYFTSHSANEQSVGTPQLTNTILKVRSTTNFGEMKLPLRTSIEYFQVSKFRDAISSIKRGNAELSLTSFSLIDTFPRGEPKLPGKTAMTDFRHVPSNAAALVSFVGTNWPSDEQISLAAAARSPKLKRQREQGAIQYFWVFVLATIVVFPPLLVWTRFRREKQKEIDLKKYEHKTLF